MADSDSGTQSPRNSLHTLAAVGGVLLGLFLLAGAYGHFAAVWPTLDNAASSSLSQRFALLKPGSILMVTGLVNIVLCRALWAGRSLALQLALAFNTIVAIYLAWLLAKGVPDHPIGVFLGLVSSYLVLLGAIRTGLVWPAVGGSSR